MRRSIVLGAVLALCACSVALAQGSPTVSTGPAQSVGNTTATLTGSLNPEGQSTQWAFQYGTSTLYGNQSATQTATGSSLQPVTAALTNLVPGTTYHYRLIAFSVDGQALGGDQTFVTTGTQPVPSPFKPTATTGAAGNVTSSGATVAGTINPSGLQTTWYFQFGTNTNYGLQTTTQNTGSAATSFAASADLSGLQSNTTYHYRLVAQNAAGTSIGADATFKTPSPPPSGSKLSIFGQTGFVSPSGMAGVLAGCIGDTNCAASLVIKRGGVILGQRSSFAISANNGGVVHVMLNATGRSLVRRRHHVRVNVIISTPGYQAAAGVITLVQFS
jgi:hypothetical protein